MKKKLKMTKLANNKPQSVNFSNSLVCCLSRQALGVSTENMVKHQEENHWVKTKTCHHQDCARPGHLGTRWQWLEWLPRGQESDSDAEDSCTVQCRRSLLYWQAEQWPTSH